jgi:superfamily II DNA or RNA helicase
VWKDHGKPIIIGKFTGANVATRHEDVKSFEAGTLDIILITEAGAVGLNLPRAKTVIIFEPSWAYADTLQALHRAVRVTSKHTDINVVHVLCVRNGTIDLDLAKYFMLDPKGSKEGTCKIWKEKFKLPNFSKNIELFIYARSIYRFYCVIYPYLTVMEKASFPTLPKKKDFVSTESELEKQFIKAEEDQMKNENLIIKITTARPVQDDEKKEEVNKDKKAKKRILK